MRAGTAALQNFAHVQQTLGKKAVAYQGVMRLGRTCLQDALPLSIEEGQLAQAHALVRTTSDLKTALDRLHAVPLGATAVGTGLGAPPGYRELAHHGNTYQHRTLDRGEQFEVLKNFLTEAELRGVLQYHAWDVSVTSFTYYWCMTCRVAGTL